MMSETTSQFSPEITHDEPQVTELRAQIERLEQTLRDANEASKNRLIQSQLRAAAIQAGMIDLDGLKLVDMSRATPNEHGELANISDLMTAMKREKPWLFGAHSTSSRATPPPAQPARAKSASEMNIDEYRAARAEILRSR